MAVAARVSGDPREAAFWAHLPATLAAVKAAAAAGGGGAGGAGALPGSPARRASRGGGRGGGAGGGVRPGRLLYSGPAPEPLPGTTAIQEVNAGGAARLERRWRGVLGRSESWSQGADSQSGAGGLVARAAPGPRPPLDFKPWTAARRQRGAAVGRGAGAGGRPGARTVARGDAARAVRRRAHAGEAVRASVPWGGGGAKGSGAEEAG
jgi:hypothetical protein